MVTGSLLGLVVEGGVLEVTHAFPFPEPTSATHNKSTATTSDINIADGDDDDDMAGLEGHEFQMEMMRMLREVNVDNNCIGWYQSMYLGSYSTSTLLENQLSYQTDLSPNAVVILYDPMQTTHGNLVLKCLRLTEECVKLKTSGKNTFLDPHNIFEEIPFEFSNPGLVQALLADISPAKVDTTMDRLDLSTNPYLEKHLEFLCSWVDDLAAEQHKFQYYSRRGGRMDHHHRRRQQQQQQQDENKQSAAEKWSSSDAPRRMESLLISNQIRAYCEQMDQFAGGGFGKLFLTGGLHKDDEKAVASGTATTAAGTTTSGST
jgi:translation initiation factor 3 subunit H